MEKDLSVKQIVNGLGSKVYKVIGSEERPVKGIGSLGNAQPDSLTFCSYSKEKSLAFTHISEEKAFKLINETKSEAIICSRDLNAENFPRNKTFIIVENPRLEFVRAFHLFFAERPSPYIHPTAVIHPEAKLHESVYIGPFCYLDKCQIGEGTIIKGNVYIYDNVKIGKNVLIHAGCVIGGDGFGFAWNEEGEMLKFPHIGEVIIEDDVELQANTHVARGALDCTKIGKGTKIDAACHIAHNVQIGKNCFIAGNTTFAGGVKVGDSCYLGISTSFKNKTKLGEHVMTGVSSAIVKDIPAKTVVMGVPARPSEQFKKILKFLEKNSEDVV